MAKVTAREPTLISFDFRQESGDSDYGSCLWAIFNFDLERYELTITSDCGNYAYGWVPTPHSESFMHLMARLDAGYLLDKLSKPCIIDVDATFMSVKQLMDSYGVDYTELDKWGDPVFDLEEIECCCDRDTEYEVHEALVEQFRDTPMEDCDDYDLWCCIEKTFTANAKKIVQIFMDYIRPRCEEISNSERGA